MSPGDAISGEDACIIGAPASIVKFFRFAFFQMQRVSSKSPGTRRVIAYIDGFNLYHGIKQSLQTNPALKRTYWLDIPSLVRRFLDKSDILVETKYFTSRVTLPSVPAQPSEHAAISDATSLTAPTETATSRQNDYIEALKSLGSVSVQFGQFNVSSRRCRECGHAWSLPNEKMTDVNIAVEMLTDAFHDRFDVVALLSADGDLQAPLKKIRQLFPSKQIWVIFPPMRGSSALTQLSDRKMKARPDLLMQCLLPETVTGIDGFPRKRPASWDFVPPKKAEGESSCEGHRG